MASEFPKQRITIITIGSFSPQIPLQSTRCNTRYSLTKLPRIQPFCSPSNKSRALPPLPSLTATSQISPTSSDPPRPLLSSSRRRAVTQAPLNQALIASTTYPHSSRLLILRLRSSRVSFGTLRRSSAASRWRAQMRNQVLRPSQQSLSVSLLSIAEAFISASIEELSLTSLWNS
jgi:hypothetical protein